MALTYGTPVALTHTNIDGLTAGNEWASTNAHDNTSTLAHDAVVSGRIDTATAPTDGDTIEIYLQALIPDVADTGEWVDSAIDDGMDGTDEVLTEGTEFFQEGLKLAAVLTVDASANSYYEFAFGVVSVLGYMPPKFQIVVRNNTAQTLGSDNNVEVTPITY